MKKIIITILFCLGTIYSFGQKQKDLITVSFGTVTPLGSLAESNSFLEDGFAKQGFSVSVDGSFYLNSNLSIAGGVFFFNHSVDRGIVQDNVIAQIESKFPVAIDPDAIESFDAGYWNHISFLTGPLLTFHPTREFYFDFKVMAGLSFIMPPSIDLLYINEDVIIDTYAESQKASLGVLVGGSFSYQMNPDYALRLGYNYFLSNVDYTLEYDHRSLPNENISYLVHSVGVTLGVTYFF